MKKDDDEDETKATIDPNEIFPSEDIDEGD